PDSEIGPAKAGVVHPVTVPPDEPAWKWLAREVQQFTRLLETPMLARGNTDAERAHSASHILACVWLRQAPDLAALAGAPALLPATEPPVLELRVTIETIQGFIQLDWSAPQDQRRVTTGRVRCTGSDELTWELEVNGQREVKYSTHH